MALGMLCLGYFTVTVTVLSLSAISTNGAIKGGGAYCKIRFPFPLPPLSNFFSFSF